MKPRAQRMRCIWDPMWPLPSSTSTVHRHRHPGHPWLHPTGTGAHHSENISDLNYMLVSRHTRLDNYCNHFKRCLVIIIIVTMAHGNLAEQTDGTNCTNAYRTCTECTKTTGTVKCKWNVWEQTCVESSPKGNPTKNMVYDQTFCPTFSVNRQNEDDDIVVSVSDDKTNIIKLMESYGPLQCILDTKINDANVDGNQIKCASDHQNNNVVALSVLFANGSRSLLFDNVTDHYQLSNSALSSSCSHCGWHDELYKYYCIWCSKGRRSDNPFQYCDKRKYPKLGYGESIRNVTLAGDQCAALTIEYFQPRDGGWMGGYELDIVVRNHDMLLKTNSPDPVYPSRFIVTVAGRSCNKISPSQKNGFKCSLSGPPKRHFTGAISDMNEGLVEVKYKGLLEITVVSTQTFRFFKIPNSSSTDLSLPSLTETTHSSSTQSQISSSNFSTTPSPPNLLNNSTTPSSTSSVAFSSSPSMNSSSTSSLASTSNQPMTLLITSSPDTSSNPSMTPLSTSSLASSSNPSTTPSSTSLQSSLSILSSPSSETMSPNSSSTLSPFSSSTSPSTLKLPTEVNTTKEALNDNFIRSRTTSALSSIVTIVMSVMLIMVLCLALICLKSPRTYNLLTFNLRNRPMEMRQLDEYQQLPRSNTDCQMHDDSSDEYVKRAA